MSMANSFSVGGFAKDRISNRRHLKKKRVRVGRLETHQVAQALKSNKMWFDSRLNHTSVGVTLCNLSEPLSPHL